MKSRKDFIGLDGFYWWFGVVENRDDPKKLGRCQVRIFGAHSADLNDIPSEDLPWAMPVHSLNNQTFSTPKEGDYVFGFFIDGQYAQQPMIMGIVPGIPQEASDPNFGFADLRTPEEIAASPKRPRSVEYATDGTGVSIEEVTDPEELAALRNPSVFQIGSPTNSPLVRNEQTENTVLNYKQNSTVTVPISETDVWQEPIPAYDAEYPFNKVWETESGHVMEFDDTPGSERVHIAHRSGTFQEIYPSGTKVEKIVKNNYKIIFSDDHVYVKGRVNLTVESNVNMKVFGHVNVEAHNDINVNAAGSVKYTVGENFLVKAKNIVLEAEESINNFTEKGSVSTLCDNFTVAATSDAVVSAEGSADISGGLVGINSQTEAAITGIAVGIAAPAITFETEIFTAPFMAMTEIPVIPISGEPVAPSASGLGEALQISAYNDPPIFYEKTPGIRLPEERQQAIDTATIEYIKNPRAFYNEEAARGGVKENFAGSPDTTGAGSAYINSKNPNTTDGSDLKAWLDEQLSKTNANGYWLETGMGGRASNPNILNIWRDLGFGNKGAWGSDQTSWCMGFVNFGLKQNGYRYVQTASAFDIRNRASDFGARQVLNYREAQPGDIALWRYSHVSFVYENVNGSLKFVGGNQKCRSRLGANAPDQGDVSMSWAGGYSAPGDGTLIGIWRPSKS